MPKMVVNVIIKCFDPFKYNDFIVPQKGTPKDGQCILSLIKEKFLIGVPQSKSILLKFKELVEYLLHQHPDLQLCLMQFLLDCFTNPLSLINEIFLKKNLEKCWHTIEEKNCALHLCLEPLHSGLKLKF